MVQEVGLRYKELNPNNKVNYHIHIETEDTEIFYDADMITIILDNLMSNAAKYTSEGDITLSLRSVEENQINTRKSVSVIPVMALTPKRYHTFRSLLSGKKQISGIGFGNRARSGQRFERIARRNPESRKRSGYGNHIHAAPAHREYVSQRYPCPT